MATHKPTKKRGLTLYDQEADQSSQTYTKVMPMPCSVGISLLLL